MVESGSSEWATRRRLEWDDRMTWDWATGTADSNSTIINKVHGNNFINGKEGVSVDLCLVRLFGTPSVVSQIQ